MKTQLSKEEKIKITNVATKAINQILLRRTVGIVWHDEEKPLDHGTGVLLRVGEEPIVVTAAHCIRDRPVEQLQLVATDQLSNRRLAPTEMDFMGGTIDEKLDVGFLRLSPEAAANMKGREFIDFGHFDVFPTGLPDDLVYLFGMADTEYKRLDFILHQYGSLTYIENIPTDYDWKIAGPRPLMLDVPYPESVENTFDRREVALPNPRGMSGGGVWRVSFGDQKIWTPQAKLVGIITEFDPDARKVEANRLEPLLHLLALHFPEAEKFVAQEASNLEHRLAS